MSQHHTPRAASRPSTFFRLAGRSILAAPLLLAGAPALAGGFYLQEQSPMGVGRAFAGEAAAADSAATIYFNPAGMTELEGTQVGAGVQLLNINARQTDLGSKRTGPGPLSVPTGGSDGGNPFAKVVPVPVGYISHQVNDRLWVGLGFNAPFGLVVDYDDDFFGRYDSLRSELRTYNVQPTLAYKLDEHFSIGGGVDIQYVKAELTSALPQLDPRLADGRVSLKGDDVSIGWNAGMAYENGGTRLGIHYRSGMNHKLDGDFTVSGLLGPIAAGNRSVDAKARLRLPDVWSFGLRQNIGDNARLLAGASWYNWSVFQKIEAVGATGVLLSSEQDYRDTFDVSVGGEYDVSKKLTLRAGTKWDKTPTIDAERTTRVPDGNRTWATVGATWHTGNLDLSASYAHVFVKGATVDRTETFYAGTPAAVSVRNFAKTSGNVDQLSFGVNWKL